MPGIRFRNRLKEIGTRTDHFIRKAAWYTCKCLFWTVCSPCVCCIVLVMPNQSRRTFGVSAQAPKPMVPCPRRRALSITSTSLQQHQRTFPQNRSAFMTKLPLEIRRIIYEKALGEVPIHLSLVNGQLNARRCATRGCACYLQSLSVKHRLHAALSLLRTCRRIYSEAIEYLYSSNKFFISTDMEDYPTMGYLPYFIQPQRMNQITNLRIDWDLDRHGFFQVDLMPQAHRDEWNRTWDVLGRMNGLRTLHIRLFFFLDLWLQCYGDFWEQNGKALLEPITKMTAPKDFVVTLPDWRCSTDLDVGKSRCVFQLPERSEDSAP
ncbi:hypothetical protein COCCADRAFT_92834 [Bipolaris zeicola 26-R-13]|uniref:DUF7730 domain-containing protein n=1 Tax=Cochliobolus carbonum (strain 26-R-13) TaxID=930089 RepID=W6Y5C2_COCC2|nr:uncharacterized protein COCCADRAFT_92834 [Bipolaris zeicola 26-R-13]EUC34702.1 hypothetical protein COCCADRAFT_92834 [Bipolaris zeicola 26-R-13]